MFVLYLGPANLLCTFSPSLPLPGARELQSPPGSTCRAPPLPVGVWDPQSTLQLCKQQHSRVTACSCSLPAAADGFPPSWDALMVMGWLMGMELADAVVAVAQVGAGRKRRVL